MLTEKNNRLDDNILTNRLKFISTRENGVAGRETLRTNGFDG